MCNHFQGITNKHLKAKEESQEWQITVISTMLQPTISGPGDMHDVKGEINKRCWTF